MRRLHTNVEILAENFSFSGLRVVDVGCGTGDLVRWLTQQGARVIGIDTPQMLAKAQAEPATGNERYWVGGAEALPVEDGWADLMVYFASLHHAPLDRLTDALAECSRVLKAGGEAAVVEPKAEPGSYFEITRLPEDEADMHAAVYAAIQAAPQFGLRLLKEEYFYIERSFADYEKLIHTFVEGEKRRAEIIARARKITVKMSQAAGARFDDFRFRSICRLNVLKKK